MTLVLEARAMPPQPTIPLEWQELVVMSKDVISPSCNKPVDAVSHENVSCLICFQIQNDLSQEALLAEFGAVRLWSDFDRHQREGHEKEESAKQSLRNLGSEAGN